MRHLFSLLLLCFASLLAVSAQQCYMAGGRVAVFYPAAYDAAAHQPSPIFERELCPTAAVAADWSLRPVFSQDGAQSVATVHVGEGVDYYGEGEVNGTLRRGGTTVTLWNTDNPNYCEEDSTRLYQSHPWLMGVRRDGTAFGLIADCTWRMTIHADADVTFRSDGPAFRVVVIEAESPQALMQQFTDLVGHAPLPPMWALGYQQCRFSYHPDTQVMNIADQLRRHRIPCDVIWMDIHYMDGFRIFTFSPEEFPHPRRVTDYLHARHFKSVCMIDPGIKVDSTFWLDREGTAADYWVQDSRHQPYVGNVWPGPCHFPDFTRPEVRRWWSGLYPALMAEGIDGVWNDMNEPAIGSSATKTMPLDAHHRGGEGLAAGPHLRYHNVYAHYMVKASRDGLLLSHPDRRPFVLSRAGFLGSHRYAAMWTGDNKSSYHHLRLSIPMSLNIGLSGQPFNGADIGGFNTSTTAELLADWTAVGAFYPFARNHCDQGGVRQEPWAFDRATLDACRTAINRRYRLLPYIYTAFEEATRTGMPVMRPVFMADVHDLALRGEEQAFLVGGDLAVVPRWAEKVHLPALWQRLTLEEQPDKYQATLYQRPGSVVPLANLAQNVEELATDSLTLLVCLDADGRATGRLYEDARDGFGYREGQYTVYTFTAQRADDGTIAVSMRHTDGTLPPRRHTLRLGLVSAGRVKYTPWREGEAVQWRF